jgi:hypothetical protein
MAQAATKDRAKPLTAQRLIREHQRAARLERRLKLKMDQLYKKHPDLENQRPSLHVHTYDSGQKVFARWIDDFDRLFPAHHPYAPNRDSFIKEAEAAFPEHDRKRKEAGIVAAEKARFDAWCARTLAFDRLCRHTPRTIREAGLIANYLLKALPIETEGKIFGRLIIPPATHKDYQDWKTRREAAFYSVEKLLRAFAKAA